MRRYEEIFRVEMVAKPELLRVGMVVDEELVRVWMVPKRDNLRQLEEVFHAPVGVPIVQPTVSKR